VKTLIQFTLFLLPIAGFAQNVDQSTNNASPYTTYTLELHVPDSILQSIPKASIEDAISPRGLKKVTKSPSLTVSFTAQNLVIIEEEVKEFLVAKKDSNGNTTRNDTSYYVQVLYSLKCEGKCYNAEKQLVYSAGWGGGQSKFTSFHMSTRQEAEDYWKNNKESLKTNFIASIVNPSIVAMGNKLSAGLPYPSAKN